MPRPAVATERSRSARSRSRRRRTSPARARRTARRSPRLNQGEALMRAERAGGENDDDAEHAVDEGHRAAVRGAEQEAALPRRRLRAGADDRKVDRDHRQHARREVEREAAEEHEQQDGERPAAFEPALLHARRLRRYWTNVRNSGARAGSRPSCRRRVKSIERARHRKGRRRPCAVPSPARLRRRTARRRDRTRSPRTRIALRTCPRPDSRRPRSPSTKANRRRRKTQAVVAGLIAQAAPAPGAARASLPAAMKPTPSANSWGTRPAAARCRPFEIDGAG